MRPCLAIDSDYLNIGIKPGMKKVPSHEILFMPTFVPSIKNIHTHFLSLSITKDGTNKIFPLIDHACLIFQGTKHIWNFY